MVIIELKEKLRKNWDVSIQVLDKSADYISSEEFRKIADVISTACNQITEITSGQKSALESHSGAH